MSLFLKHSSDPDDIWHSPIEPAGIRSWMLICGRLLSSGKSSEEESELQSIEGLFLYEFK